MKPHLEHSALSADWLISDVTIVTPGQPMLRNAAMRINGGVIEWIGLMSAVGLVSPDVTTLSGRGGICMPGFINTHNHTPLMIVRGMFEDLGFAPAYTPGIPQGHWLSEEEAFALSRLGYLELLLAGCTTVVDYYRHPAALARAAIESGARAFIGGRVMDADAGALAEGRFEQNKALGEANLREAMDAIERYEGVDDGRIRGIHAPHAPDTCSPDLLREVATLAKIDGRPVHTHLAQSRLEVSQVKARDGVGPGELLEQVGLLNENLFAAHCLFLDDKEIACFGAAGSTVCHAPIGNAAAGCIAPIEALMRAGAHISLCTDTKSGDMFESMRMAIAGARILAGGQMHLDAETALAWGTSGGAQALGIGDVTGQLAVGYAADFIVLDADAGNLRPQVDGVGLAVHSGTSGNVRHVFVGGKQLVSNGQTTVVDAGEVVRTAQDVSDRLWARARNNPG